MASPLKGSKPSETMKQILFIDDDARDGLVDDTAVAVATDDNAGGTNQSPLKLATNKIQVDTDNPLEFRDSALYIKSPSDAQLDIGADTKVYIDSPLLDCKTDVDIGGTLDVTGATGVDGDFDINTDKLTVASATGNTAIAGTLGVTGVVTANGSVVVDDTTIDSNTIATTETDITLDSAKDIILDAADADISLKDDGTQFLKFTNNSGDCEISNGVADKDIIFKDIGGNEVMRVDGSTESLLVASGKEIQFADSGENISGDGTDLTVTSGNDINLTATADINVPSGVGLTLGGDDHKIESDGTDLDIESSGNLNLTSSVAEADAIKLNASDTSGTVNVTSAGTGSSAIDINSAGGVDIDATGGGIDIYSEEDATNAIHLHANGGTSETIKIHSDQGTGRDSIELLSDAGGIAIEAGTTVDIDADEDITIDTTDTTDGISIGTGTSEVPITLGHSTSDVTIGDVLDVTDTVKTDTISEHTADTGVTIDGVLVKDNDVEADEVRTDDIVEKTGDSGVTIEGVLIKDSKVYEGGAEISSVVTLTEDSDDLDVENKDTVFVNTSGGNIVLGGLTNGVDGQSINIVIEDVSNNFTIEHKEGIGGSQDIYLNGKADHTFTADYGGTTLVCNGTNWFECGR